MGVIEEVRYQPLADCGGGRMTGRLSLKLALYLLVAFAIVMLINPVGFVGGGRDDGRYLEAVRCWVEQGACLPQNHWQGRWPVYVPIAILAALFGETRITISLWPLLCGFFALFLLAVLGTRLRNVTAGATASLLLLAAPAFSIQLLRPSSEAIELLFILGGALCLMNWTVQQKGLWIFASGLLFGLAFQVRETSIAAAGLAAISIFALGYKPRLSHVTYGIVGFLIPLAAELLIYAQLTGDPLYRRHLSLAHIRVPSTELPRTVDRSRSPIFNPDIIANWRRDPGIHVHWLIDGPLNLIFNAKAGFSLLLTPFLLLAARRRVSSETWRAAWILLGLAGAYILAITYALAMDPKPRVMLTALASSSLAFALVLDDLWRKQFKLLAAACFGCSVFAGLIFLAGYIRPVWADQQATAWHDQFRGSIEADQMSRRVLTLNPAVRAMPGIGAARPYAMVFSVRDCHEWIRRGELGSSLAVEGEKRLTLMRNESQKGAWLCLFKYQQPVSAEQMDRARRKVWGGAEKIDP